MWLMAFWKNRVKHRLSVLPESHAGVSCKRERFSSEGVVLLEMFCLVSSETRTRRLQLFLRSRSCLSSTISLSFSLSTSPSTVPASLVTTLFRVTHPPPAIRSIIFSVFSGVLWQLEANGNKKETRDAGKEKLPTAPLTSPVVCGIERESWGVTRGKRRGSGAD